MMQFVIAAPRSGSGKTTVTCALLAALKNRGYAPCAFKSGPDYIDPMFHRSVLGVESHNLDLYLSAKNTVRELYAHYAAGHGAVVCEGLCISFSAHLCIRSFRFSSFLMASSMLSGSKGLIVILSCMDIPLNLPYRP